LALRRLGGLLGVICLVGVGVDVAQCGFELERMRLAAQQRFGSAGGEAVDAWRNALGGWRGLGEDEQLRRINDYFNRRVRFADDNAVWSQADYWATPMETIAGGQVIARTSSLPSISPCVSLALPKTVCA
jgi:hypothetical protein